MHAQPRHSTYTLHDEPDLPRRTSQALAALPPRHPERAALRAQVIELHLPLTRRLARRFHHGGETPEDLYQVAAEGLLKAVDRFDPRRGEVFTAFAVPTIIGELKRHFRDQSWHVRAPRRLQELHVQVRAAVDELTPRLRRSPRVAEIAAHLALPEEHVIEAISSAEYRRPRSLNAPPGVAASHAEVSDLVGADDPSFADIDARLTVAALLAGLPERERRIVTLRFYGNQSQSQIARQVGISQMHVSRLLSRALRRLRRRLNAAGPARPDQASAGRQGAP
jgi:RNA polymerase sigma-B factor